MANNVFDLYDQYVTEYLDKGYTRDVAEAKALADVENSVLREAGMRFAEIFKDNLDDIREFTENAGYEPGLIDDIIEGSAEIPIELLAMLSRQYDVDLNYLICGI